MVKGLYTAYTGLVNQQDRLDVITNNLANAATTGFKREGATATSFANALAVRMKDDRAQGMSRQIGQFTPGVRVGENYRDLSQGAFRITDNMYDLAIDGSGFFALAFTDQAGVTSVKYTRDGSFTVDSDGFLRTKDGDFVLNQAGALTSNPSQENYVRVNPNEPLVVDEQGNLHQNGVVVGQIGLVNVVDESFLEKYGENMFRLVTGGQIEPSTAVINQGALEMSNVNVVTEMVEMITISRAFEMNQRIVQVTDASLDRLVNQVGRV